jgi:hypothetical protein
VKVCDGVGNVRTSAEVAVTVDSTVPTTALNAPAQKIKSYLWNKLSGDGTIVGSRMPVNASNGNAPLPEDQLADIQNWISDDALDN